MTCLGTLRSFSPSRLMVVTPSVPYSYASADCSSYSARRSVICRQSSLRRLKLTRLLMRSTVFLMSWGECQPLKSSSAAYACPSSAGHAYGSPAPSTYADGGPSVAAGWSTS